MRGLLDTSVFVARERERPVERLPDEAAISVMTLGELHVGVLVSRDPAARATQLRTLTEVERRFDALPVDDTVARRFAEIVAEARRLGRRPQVVDTLIAATAAAHGIPVFTQHTDFEAIPGVEVVRV